MKRNKKTLKLTKEIRNKVRKQIELRKKNYVHNRFYCWPVIQYVRQKEPITRITSISNSIFLFTCYLRTYRPRVKVEVCESEYTKQLFSRYHSERYERYTSREMEEWNYLRRKFIKECLNKLDSKDFYECIGYDYPDKNEYPVEYLVDHQ